MRLTLAAPAFAAVALAAPAIAQPYYGAPRGSYERYCTDIRMEGQFLSAYCRGSQGSGRSSINVASCSTDIFVDPSGALTCIGPGGGQPPAVRNAPPGYSTGPGPGYDPRYGPPPAYDARPRGYQGGYGRAFADLYPGPGWRGAPVRIYGPAPNLAEVGINDRVGSIRLPPRDGGWIVCTDADFRGRCTTVWRNLRDTREIGMADQISSMRPAQ